MKRLLHFLFLAIAVLCFAGCKSFNVKRTARFIDMDAQTITVEYGEDPNREHSGNGSAFDLNGKIRMRLPSGKKVYLYQTMVQTGILYRSKDLSYSYYEKGVCCALSHDGKLIFEGVYCRDDKNNQSKPRPKRK